MSLVSYVSKLLVQVPILNLSSLLAVHLQLSTTRLPAKDLNAGLLDQRLALDFIRDNAATFGGDAAKVTIWGQSAGGFDIDDSASTYGLMTMCSIITGASSVGMHYLFPPSTGGATFRGAIQDSGTAQVYARCLVLIGIYANTDHRLSVFSLTVPHVEEYDLQNGPFTNLLDTTGCGGAGALACLRNLTITECGCGSLFHVISCLPIYLHHHLVYSLLPLKLTH